MNCTETLCRFYTVCDYKEIRCFECPCGICIKNPICGNACEDFFVSTTASILRKNFIKILGKGTGVSS